MTSHKSPGFTLVELAIALMVIGLLIGGVLKGIELVDNARNAQLTRQIHSYQTAVTNFVSIYRAIPGDLRSPASRLPNCTTNPCNYAYADFKNDGQIGSGELTYANMNTLTAYLWGYNEVRSFWVHLAVTGLISGIDTTIPVGAMLAQPFSGQFGRELPAGPHSGTGFVVQRYGRSVSTGARMKSGSYYLLRRIADTGVEAYALTPSQAFYVDQKQDDGRPRSGLVRAVGPQGGGFPSASCASATDYLVTGDGAVCNLIAPLM